MIFPKRSLLLVALSIVLSTVGCATTTEISGFEAFAGAGDQYAQAVDSLLTTSGQILVDTNSDKLLETGLEFPGSVTLAELAEQDQALGANLQEIRRLRAHVALLSQYFDTLAALASSGAPSALGTAAANTVSELNTLSESLRKGPLVSAGDAAAAGELVSQVGGLVVRGVQAHELRDELEARKETIARILQLHQTLFDLLGNQVGADQDFVRKRQYEKEVAGPLIAGTISDPASWKEQRYELLQQAPIEAQWTAARLAAGKLQTAWAQLLSNSLTPADIEAVVAELEPVLTAVKTIEANRNSSHSPVTPVEEVPDAD